MANFVIIGVGGYIAPRHLEAIKSVGGQLIAAFDVKDSVGILDRYFPDCQFFTEFELFEAYTESLIKTPQKIDYVSICSPNYLHGSHIKFALRIGAHAICEKPLVLTTKDIDELTLLEEKYKKNIYTILQLRVHDTIVNLRNKINSQNKDRYQVELTYMTSRGPWYLTSWKGNLQKSGGLSTNIGIHFFDMLTWIFGPATEIKINQKNEMLESGSLTLKKADVQWYLTIDRNNLPQEQKSKKQTTFRSIKIDDEELEFSQGFTELHNRVYADILSGKGYRAIDTRPAIEIAEKIRNLS